jgi:hypothetical protein
MPYELDAEVALQQLRAETFASSDYLPLGRTVTLERDHSSTGSKLGAGLAIWEQEVYNVAATRNLAYPTAISQFATRILHRSNASPTMTR